MHEYYYYFKDLGPVPETFYHLPVGKFVLPLGKTILPAGRSFYRPVM